MVQTKLKIIADINKQTFLPGAFSEVLYLDTGSITKGHIESFHKINPIKRIPSRAKRAVTNNTIVYSNVRPSQEHYGIFTKPAPNIVVSTGFTTIDIKNINDYYPKFVYYYLIQKHITNMLQTIAEANVSAYPSINANSLEELVIQVPSFEKQKIIAENLSLIDRKIETNNTINIKLEKIAKTIYDYWFIQFDFPNAEGKPYKSSGGKMVYNEILKREIPYGWTVEKLSNLFKFEKGTEVGSSAYYSINEDENFVKYYRVADIDGNCPTYVDKTKNKLVFVEPDNVIVTFDGSVGKVGIGLCGAISSGLRKIYDAKNKIENAMIWQIFNDEVIQKTIHRYSNGSVLKHAGSSIEYLMISYPYNEEIVKSFQDKIKSMYSQIVKNKIQNNDLVALRDFLLPLLMNRQVTIKSDEDKTEESVSILAGIILTYDQFKQQLRINARGELDEGTLRNMYDAYCAKAKVKHGQKKD